VAKLPIGSKKVMGWNDGTEVLYHYAKFDETDDARHRESTKCDVFVLFFVCYGGPLNGAADALALFKRK